MTLNDSQKWMLIAGTAGLCFLLYLLTPVLTPFLAAALLAYLGDPLVDRLEARKLSRTLSVVVVFVSLFLVLIIVLILLFQGIGIAIVALTAVLGLTCVWLVGWQRGKKLYGIFYEEELIKLKWESAGKTPNYKKTIEETIEAQVQKALIERWLQ